MIFRLRALLAAAILIVPFLAGLFVSALFAAVIKAIHVKQPMAVGTLLHFLVLVVILHGATMLLSGYLRQFSPDWSLYGMQKRTWLVFLRISYIVGLLAGQFLLPTH